jgi:hypothetical protein
MVAVSVVPNRKSGNKAHFEMTERRSNLRRKNSIPSQKYRPAAKRMATSEIKRTPTRVGTLKDFDVTVNSH